MKDEVLSVKFENLTERVEELESMVSALATKQDISDLRDSLQVLITVVETGSGIFKFIVFLGLLAGALTGILTFVKACLTRIAQ